MDERNTCQLQPKVPDKLERLVGERRDIDLTPDQSLDFNPVVDVTSRSGDCARWAAYFPSYPHPRRLVTR
jgi:hypothetical protein